MLDEAIETGAIVVSRDEFKDLYKVCSIFMHYFITFFHKEEIFDIFNSIY